MFFFQNVDGHIVIPGTLIIDTGLIEAYSLIQNTFLVNGSQLAKLEESIHHATAIKFILYKQLVKKIQLYLKNYDFFEYVKFRAIS